MYLPENTLLQGGKYRIIRPISHGGFGCTYEAEHIMLKKRVAIKEFFVSDFCNRDATNHHVAVGTLSKKGLVEKLKRKFIDEACSLCQLDHPGIVKVADVFEENGTAYYVMDYIEGESLNDLLKRQGALSESVAVNYIRQVAEALRYVHSQNRLHLDIKPGNIMLNKKDNAILIDFGVSKQYDELEGENTSTLMGKTPGFAPPEQMSNNVVKFLPSTDIYALGATLYKLLTGVTPPSTNDLVSGNQALIPLPKSISTSTRQAVAQAMLLNKNDRTQSIEEFLALLDTPVVVAQSAPNLSKDKTEVEGNAKKEVKPEEEIVEIPVTPVTPPTPPTLQPEKKGKGKWILWGALIVLLLLGFGYLFMQQGEEKEENDAPRVTTIDMDDSDLSPVEETDIVFNDYDEALAYAQKVKKPILIEFSGYGCVNSRKMEALVLNDKKVKQIIGTKYVYVTLMVDDRVSLEQPITVVENGKTKTLRTVGDKWSFLQQNKFGAAAQPYYVVLDVEGNMLSDFDGYDEDVSKFKAFLEKGLKMFRKSSNTTSASLPTFSKLVEEYAPKPVSPSTIEAVHLGLSVKWATCNVGATTPGEYGDYFAWGEINPKETYTEENSLTYGDSGYDKIGGNPGYDVARANWGGQWRLPTDDELRDLKEKCEWEWTTQNGNKGYKVTGPNGNSIFLPAAGYRYGGVSYDVGSDGSYWNSTPLESSTDRAYYLGFYSGNYHVGWNYRHFGFSVRPVVDL